MRLCDFFCPMPAIWHATTAGKRRNLHTGRQARAQRFFLMNGTGPPGGE